MMWFKGLPSWLWLFCVLGMTGGCAGLPAAAANAQNQEDSNSGEYDGWLFKSLTGGKTAQASPPTSPAATPTTANPSGIQQVSATAPNTDMGPLIPGPASASKWNSSASGTSIAGPPPTIPAELPPPPADAVSISKAKAEAEKNKGFELADLAPENVYKNIKKAAGYGPDEKIARTALGEGKTLFQEKKYQEAAGKFATAADRWPDSPLEEDALFLKGESEFFADLYSKAHDTYGGLLKKYSNTRYLDTVMARQFAIGRFWEQTYEKKPSWPVTPNLTDSTRPKFDTFGYAVQAYERIRQNDPTGPLADDSLMALGNAYFRRGQFENAAYNYDQLIKEYPNSEFQPKAHMLGLQSKMRIYQGTFYVKEPLDDAKKIADRTITQFQGQLGPEVERVAKARAQIVEEKANRDFALGEYYSKRKYFGAARMYYQSVIDEYPSTEKANEAQKRLEAIRNEPDTPPNHFAWLTDLFESKK